MRRARGLLGAVCGAWLLAGCSQLPVYERPDAAVPAAYPGEPMASGAAPSAVAMDWRTFFADPPLRARITQALDHNRDLRVATLRIEEARAQYGIVQADRRPGLAARANASFSRGEGESSASGGGAQAGDGGNEADAATGAGNGASSGAGGGRSSSRRSYSVSVGLLAYEIDFWGRLRSLDAAARARYLQTTQARQAFELSLIADVAEAYLAGQAFDERETLTRTVLRTREASLRLARLRLAEGEGSQLEVQQELTLIAQARAQLAELASQAARNRNLLDLLTGYAAPVPPGPPAAANSTFVELPAGLPSDLLARRPDVLAAEQALQAANADVGAARAAFFPRISLTAALGLASPELSRLFEGDSFFASASPSLVAPLFDGGRNRANEQLALARREIAVAQYQRAVQVAFREVADALAARSYFAEQLAARQDERTAQAERLRLAELRFREGEADSLEVLDARRELFAVEQALVEVRRAMRANAVTLYAALGGGGACAADDGGACPASR